MFTTLLGWRHLPLAVTALALAATLFWANNLASQRDAARALADSRAETAAHLTSQLKGRDALIAQQNAAVERIAKVRQEDRVIYLQNYAQADERASRHDDRAAQIMALPNEQLDELAQCRASRLLLEEELTE